MGDDAPEPENAEEAPEAVEAKPEAEEAKPEPEIAEAKPEVEEAKPEVVEAKPEPVEAAAAPPAPEPPGDPKKEWPLALGMMIVVAFIAWAFVTVLRAE